MVQPRLPRPSGRRNDGEVCVPTRIGRRGLDVEIKKNRGIGRP